MVACIPNLCDRRINRAAQFLPRPRRSQCDKRGFEATWDPPVLPESRLRFPSLAVLGDCGAAKRPFFSNEDGIVDRGLQHLSSLLEEL